MTLDLLTSPAVRNALAGAALVSLGSAPLGVFLVLRRMSLMGDVMAHAILPGVATSFILYGMSIPAMSIGGLLAGLAVVLLAGIVSRYTAAREDAALAAFYLIAVAAGVAMIALHGNSKDLEDILFGDARTLTSPTLMAMACVSAFTILVLTLIYRPLVVDSFDPVFLRSVRGRGGLIHAIFLMLAVLNMVESYRTMGTLMSAGLMLVPAIAAQFWTRELRIMIALSILFGLMGAIGGLALAFTHDLPTGPAIILSVGAIYIVSLLLGRFGSIRARYFPLPHFKH